MTVEEGLRARVAELEELLSTAEYLLVSVGWTPSRWETCVREALRCLRKARGQKWCVGHAARTAAIENLKPIHDRVLIKRDDYDNESESGVIKSHNPKAKRVFTGIIVSIGPGKQNAKGTFIETTLQPGQHVLWRKYAGSDFELSHSDYPGYVQCVEDDIVALVEE